MSPKYFWFFSEPFVSIKIILVGVNLKEYNRLDSQHIGVPNLFIIKTSHAYSLVTWVWDQDLSFTFLELWWNYSVCPNSVSPIMVIIVLSLLCIRVPWDDLWECSEFTTQCQVKYCFVVRYALSKLYMLSSSLSNLPTVLTSTWHFESKVSSETLRVDILGRGMFPSTLNYKVTFS